MAAPKDYLGQVRQIYKDAVNRWRYVNDPVGAELLSHGPEALHNLVLGLDGRGVGRGYGAGDCDCIAAAVGAELAAIGRPVKIAVTAPVGSPAGPGFSHIFVQALVPKRGWVTVDPVVHPAHGFGYTPRHSRIAYYDLHGRRIGWSGNLTSGIGFAGEQETDNMTGQYVRIPIDQTQHLGFGGIDSYMGEGEPEEWRKYGLPMWGAHVGTMGLISGENLNGLAAEVDVDLYGNRVAARTPMLEVTPEDYRYIQTVRYPYAGMLALGDDGTVYEYDGMDGFFKKLFRRIKKRVKKVAKRIKSGIHRVLKKTRVGRFLIKVGGKVKKIAMKIVKPLVKFVGKYAAKLAPVAAMIPGYGPAIAGALYGAGKVAKLMSKYGAKITGTAGKVRDIAFPSGDSRQKFQRELEKAAKKEARKRSGPRKPAVRRAINRGISRRRYPRIPSRW